MNNSIDSQHLACRFNLDEAVWRRYCEIRLAHNHRQPLPESLAKLFDQLDWLSAERDVEKAYPIAIAKTL